MLDLAPPPLSIPSFPPFSRKARGAASETESSFGVEGINRRRSTRRALLLAASAWAVLAAPPACFAQRQAAKVPRIGWFSGEYAPSGSPERPAKIPRIGYLSYGADLRDITRYTATYVDKILKGAKAAELPIEQATKVELLVNTKAARSLGLTVPQSILLRADRVIE